MQEQQTGSQWDIIMTVLIEGKKYINIPSYRYRDELSTIGYLDQSSNVRLVCVSKRKFFSSSFLLSFYFTINSNNSMTL